MAAIKATAVRMIVVALLITAAAAADATPTTPWATTAGSSTPPLIRLLLITMLGLPTRPSICDTFQCGGGSNQFGSRDGYICAIGHRGTQYYFSQDADDGGQCQHGMAFEIKVSHGLGLPEPQPTASSSLCSSPAAADEGQSPPITVVTSPPQWWWDED
ncbi:hypothetical protein DH2020_023221 [Rehmannia glutinosa]|uniref:Uncharacterized protein n=1 Tax=Rehmannia glutinosa TaxID=99300 RepID=A0ABR0W5E5_REHGL